MANEKKKVLIVNNNLATGGVQRSLVNLINQVKDQYDLTLFIFDYSGDYVNLMPSKIKVIEASPLLKLLGMSQAQTKNLGFMYYAARAAFASYTKTFSNHLPISLLVSTQKRLSGFDVAISFLHNAEEKSLYGGCNAFVLKRVNANQKITFSHCDFSNYGGNTPRNREMYKHFDKIATVSEGCQQSFIKTIPSLAERTHCVYNCHNYSEYINKANVNPVEYPKDSLNIVTVARLSPEKGILRGVQVIKRLVNENYRIRWYIVGDGAQKSEVENEIKINHLSEHVTLYGNQENPYRFIRNADLFFLPSFHEAAPMVFDEAKCLSVPIITTNTTSAKEMVRDGLEGIVCGNNEEEIYIAIKRVLDDPLFIERCREYLGKQNYTNETAVEQFRMLISDGEL
ncbi:glycosyltransferase [Peribacillus huizhouensis]|uniref:Glycosyltransferase involved in cell wall biosynthesis n=1 Tax=Peribacillus huizhouensis TaxID=1501239 RepID=A0ABR6CKS3_9BACI|nr:glycosyltransferase [Peribacillus huizhouensis]MBA9025657.1 glycosyltransferase involved in cell wall biosynthesis [Peribacillus huizhouensis]